MASNYSKTSSAPLLAAACLALWVNLGAVLAEDQDIGKPKAVTPSAQQLPLTRFRSSNGFSSLVQMQPMSESVIPRRISVWFYRNPCC
jgi:hypothetical protein